MSLESLVLDSQGFSGWIDRDRKVMRLLEQAERDGTDLAMSAATIIEVSHSGVDSARAQGMAIVASSEPSSGMRIRRVR